MKENPIHHLTRREFLAGTLSSATGVGILSTFSSGTLFGGPASARLRLGLATYEWGMNWDIPALIRNCQKADVLGVELRTQSKYKHGVELELGPARRAEVKQRFADSPVAVVAVACSERLDWPEPEKLKAALAAAKQYLQLSHDIGAASLRVFPNQFHPNVPREKTVEQIARAANELGSFAVGLGQRVDLEAHGPAGDLATMKAVMDQVTAKAVGIRLNCDQRDVSGGGLAANFKLVSQHLAKTVHLHNLKDTTFPYPELVPLLAKSGWDGWALLENTEKEPDLVAALIEQREIWEKLLKAKAT